MNLRLAMAATLAATFAMLPGHASAGTVTIDPGTKHQRFDGFGAGNIFYEGHLTDGVPSALRSETYDNLFSRLNNRFLMIRFRADREDTNDNGDPDVVNWAGFGSPNAATVTVAREALARNPDMAMIATVYSPPQWLKTNGSTNGGGTLDASAPDAYEEFGEFMFAYLHRFKELGIDIDILAPMNEPNWVLSHEDASYTEIQARDVFRHSIEHLRVLVASAQNTAGVAMPQIMGPQCGAVDSATSYVNTIKGDAAAWANIDLVACHQYGGDSLANFTALNTAADGKPVFMSEWHCVHLQDPPYVDDDEIVDQGTAIIKALRGGCSGYLWFENNHPNNGFAGLIHSPWGGAPEYHQTYHSWHQWSEMAPPGSRRIGTTESGLGGSVEGVVAFQEDDGDGVYLHVVQSGGPDTLDLSVDGFEITRVEQWSTSATDSYAKVLDVSSKSGWQQYSVVLDGKQLASFRLTIRKAHVWGGGDASGPIAWGKPGNWWADEAGTIPSGSVAGSPTDRVVLHTGTAAGGLNDRRDEIKMYADRDVGDLVVVPGAGFDSNAGGSPMGGFDIRRGDNEVRKLVLHGNLAIDLRSDGSATGRVLRFDGSGTGLVANGEAELAFAHQGEVELNVDHVSDAVEIGFDVVDGSPANATRLVKTGAGSLLLNTPRSNTFSGGWRIAGGTLGIGDGSARGNLGPGDIEVHAGTLALDRPDGVALPQSVDLRGGSKVRAIRGSSTIDGVLRMDAESASTVILQADAGATLDLPAGGTALASPWFAVRKLADGDRFAVDEVRIDQGGNSWIWTSAPPDWSMVHVGGNSSYALGSAAFPYLQGNAGNSIYQQVPIAIDPGQPAAVSVRIADFHQAWSNGGPVEFGLFAGEPATGDAFAISSVADVPDYNGVELADGLGNTGGNVDYSLTLNPEADIAMAATNLWLWGGGQGVIGKSLASDGANATVVKDGSGTWTLSNSHNNWSAGGLRIKNGVLRCGDDEVIPHGPGKGGLTIDAAGNLDLLGHAETVNALSGDGGVDNSAETPALLIVGSDDASAVFGGEIRDTGSQLALTKTGAGRSELTGFQSYRGDTTIDGGTLALGTASLADGSTVRINGAASILELNHGAIDQVAALVIDGVAMPDGMWGAVGSGATHTDDVHFSGTGILRVGLVGIYSAWADATGLDGTNNGFDADADGDHLANGIEWILGGHPLTQDAGTLYQVYRNPAGGLALEFDREEDSVGVATLRVEWDTDLTGDFSKSIAIGTNSSSDPLSGATVTIDNSATPDRVTVEIPAGSPTAGRTFARLVATHWE